MKKRALIFDCDGVLADTERNGHLVAFNQTFEHFELGTEWSDSHYKKILSIGGGKERLATIFRDSALSYLGLTEDLAEQADLISKWHRYKTQRYTDLIRSGALPGRPGVRRLAEEAHAAGWKLAVASTSAEVSVRSVLEHVMGPIAAEFDVFAGDVVPSKKPAPDIYRFALHELGIQADAAVAVEDSSIGLRAAIGAGIPTVVTTSGYTAEQDFASASFVVSCLGDLPHHAATVVADPLNIDPQGEVVLGHIKNLPLPELARNA